MIPLAQSLRPELFSQITAIANKKSLLFAQTKKTRPHRMRRHAGCRISQIKRKRIEQCFGWPNVRPPRARGVAPGLAPHEMWSTRRLREVSALLEQFEFSGIIRRLSIE